MVTPASNLRLLLAVASVCLVALAASRPIESAPAPDRAAGPAAAPCSKATATQLVNQYQLNYFLLQQPVAQLLCGEFTGPGSEAMAVGIAAPTCWPIQGWAVFSVSNGSWQLVVIPGEQFIFPLVAVGADVREIVPISRAGDPRCIPSGGAKARLWHWNGSSLVAGAWRRIRTQAEFYSPTRNLGCELDDYRGDIPSQVYCQSWKAPHSVRLKLNGALKRCSGRRCLGNPGQHTPKLAYGKKITVGRFRCFSRRVGVECVVISTGKGFLIDSKGTRRIRL
jgi:hypothetical protein